MPAATDIDWTVEMLDALPDDGQRYELIDGVLHVTPAPSDVHQLVAGAADVFAVRLTDQKRPPYPYGLNDLLLAIEVQSPSNPLLDYQVKRALYLTNGIPEYWIVNADARVVSRWRNTEEPGEVFDRKIIWHPDGMPAPLIIDLPALFEDALG